MYRFTGREIKDLLQAWIALAFAFAILYSFNIADVKAFSFSQFLLFFGISLFTAGTGFLLHELAHKIVAQRYGSRAEFYAFPRMLLLAIGMSFLGFLFAAPGAVFIRGKMSRSQHGKVAVAGPLVNIILASLFLVLRFVYSNALLLSFGLSINAWLGLFNMIPAMPFDGAKVWQWNKAVYFFVVGISLLLVWGSFSL